jgi:hypothetical protein
MPTNSTRLFQRFLLDLVTDFVALVSGIASAVLALIGASKRTPLPNWAFWVAAAVCLVYAAYRTWRKQYLAADLLRTTLANVTEKISVTCSASRFEITGRVNDGTKDGLIGLYFRIPIAIRNQRETHTTVTSTYLSFAVATQYNVEYLAIAQRSEQPQPLSLPPKRTVDIGPGQTLELMIEARVLVPNNPKEWGGPYLRGTLLFEDTFAGTLSPAEFTASNQPFNYGRIRTV